MAWWNRLLSPPTETARVASAARMELGGGADRDFRRTQQDWQARAWQVYHRVGEIHDAIEYVANALSRLRLFAGEQDEAGELVESKNDQAQDLVSQLGSGMELRGIEGHPALLHDLGVHLNVPGESYLLETDKVWDLLSTDELLVNGNRFQRKRDPAAQAEDIPDGATMIRIWRPNPQWSSLADSPLRSNLDRAEELMLLGDHIMAALRSRLPAGIFFVPEELSFPKDEAGNDTFDAEFLEAVTTAVSDPRSAMAWAPMLLRGKAEFGEKIRHITFEHALDQYHADRRREIMERLEQGLPLPVGKVSGVKDVNHWGAWQIDEDSWEGYIKPVAMLIVDGLSYGYLRPFLLGDGMNEATASKFRIWFDESDLVVRPDRSGDAFKAHEALALSDEALRARLDFDEEEAPDEEEYRRRVAIVLKDPSALPGPSEQRRPQPEEGPPAIAAASVSSLGSRLHRLETNLRDRLFVAADNAVRRALEKAGSRLRSRLGKKRGVEASVTGIPNEQIPAHLGQGIVAQLGTNHRQLLDGAFEEFLARADKWIRDTQLAAVAEISEVIGEDVTAELVPSFDAKRAEAMGFLRESMILYGMERLDDPDPEPPERGEWDDLLAPHAEIRRALDVAGGLDDALTAGLLGRLVGLGVATGRYILDLLTDRGTTLAGFIWRHGTPARPFPAHRALDGTTVAGPDDFALLVSPEDSWVGSFYFPGDHSRCTCSLEPTFLA